MTCAHSHCKFANFMRRSNSVFSSSARKLQNTLATNGLVTPVVDRPDIHNRFGGAEDVLDCPECFVDVSDRLGVVEAISAQHPEPVAERIWPSLIISKRRERGTPLILAAALTRFQRQYWEGDSTISKSDNVSTKHVSSCFSVIKKTP